MFFEFGRIDYWLLGKAQMLVYRLPYSKFSVAAALVLASAATILSAAMFITGAPVYGRDVASFWCVCISLLVVGCLRAMEFFCLTEIVKEFDTHHKRERFMLDIAAASNEFARRDALREVALVGVGAVFFGAFAFAGWHDADMTFAIVALALSVGFSLGAQYVLGCFIYPPNMIDLDPEPMQRLA
ncbi:MAG: hypothetical protein PHV99_03250 [Candidatus Pacebacteria bacterium]|nr:hypothetical protein [Candidatus Paceibacterota bacterium]